MPAERLNAIAKALGLTPQQLEDKLKTQTMQQMITAAGFTKDSFRQKVHDQLKTDLEGEGYSGSQISTAFSRTRHHHA